MTDIATLGLAVDSSQVKTATTTLNQFTAAAKPAAAAAKDTAAAHGGLSTQAMAAGHAVRSMAESLALGMSPTQALTAQMNHLSYAASGPGGLKGAFGEAFSALTRFLSPAVLIGGAFAAAAAGSYLLYSNIVKTEKQFDDLGKSLGDTTANLHSLEAAASFKGIDTASFLTDIGKISDDVYQARFNMGGLANVLRANGQSAQGFEDAFGKIADLIHNASGDTQLQFSILRQVGLPATMEWVRFLQQGSAGIKAARDEAVKMNTGAAQDLVDKARAFDEAWDKAWKNFKDGSKSATLTAFDYISKIIDAARNFHPSVSIAVPDIVKQNALKGALPGLTLGANSNVDAFYNSLGSKAPGNAATAKTTIDPQRAAHDLALEQQRLGILGQTASVDQQVRSAEISVQQARANGVTVTSKELTTLKDLARERALGIDQLKAQTDSYNVESATVGMSVGQAAAYTAEQNRINQAIRDHQTLTASDIAAIHAQAGALGDAAQRADLMKSAYEGLVRGPLQTLTQQIANGAKFFDALKQSGISALNAVASKLMDIAAQNLWQSAFGGAAGGGGGGLLSLLGLGGGSSALPAGASGVIGAAGPGFVVPTFHSGYMPGDPIRNTRSVSPSLFNNAPRFHSGIGPGERAAIIRTDESVLTPAQMRAAGGGGSVTVHAGDIVIQGDASEKTVALIQQQRQQMLAELPNRVIAAVRVAQQQRKL